MALVKCKECGSEISDKAEACPKCGAKRSSPNGCLVFIIFIVVVTAIGMFLSDDKETKQAENKPCAKTDLSCRGEEGVVHASVYCSDPIERLAEHSMKWTDGALDLKFSRYMWTDQPGGHITYIGDKAEFQNGFGAYTPVIYACEMDDKKVIDVHIVKEGRLPAN